jgi:ATP-dependent helicase/nuclease subunit B
MKKELFSLLESGCVVVTGNNRLARHLVLEYGREQQRRGSAAWLDPAVLPWSAWVLRLWNESRLIGRQGSQPLRLLSATQSLLLWEQLIEQHNDRHPTDNPAALARLSARSWALLNEWRIAPGEHKTGAFSPDHRAFFDWCTAFRQKCAAERWVTQEQLPELVTDALGAGDVRLSSPVRLAGFEQLNPAQQWLVAEAVAAGADIACLNPVASRPVGRQAVFQDDAAELAAAAGWAREQLQQHPGDSVAVLVPDLQQRAAAVRRVFMDRLMPDWRTSSGQFLPPINLSLGQPLSEKGMISTALRLLSLPWRALPFADISLLLRSPYLGGFTGEQQQRAAAEIKLREQSIVELRAGAISRYLAETAPVASQLFAAIPQWRGGSLPSVWAERFSGLLKQLGWPGDETPESAEYRAFSKWQELLAELSGLDGITGPVTAIRALKVLRNLAANTLFQAEGNPDAVQVMGLLEASGHEFAHLWICGMTSDMWPQSAQPDPLLPYTLQREREMPNSSPAVTQRFAAGVIQAILASCPEPIVSWPRFRDEEELQPAPIPGSTLTAWHPETDSLPAFAHAIYQSRELEQVAGDDDIPPPVPAGQVVFGGAGLLAQQAGCPARAFVERRLGAKELRRAVAGLDPMTRGELMHEVLEHWYRQNPESSTLTNLPAAERASRLKTVIDGLLAPRIERASGVLAIVTAQEAARLQVLIEQFFELEMSREPFSVVATEQPCVVEIEGLKLTLRLDRLDRISSGDLLVIDYKSSRIAAQGWAPPRPLEPQLPLYAVMNRADGIAIAQVSSKGVRIDGWSDAPTGLKTVKSVEKLKFDVEDWEGLVEAWRESFSTLAQEFLAGDFRVNLEDTALARGEFGLVIRTAELAGFADDEEAEGDAND